MLWCMFMRGIQYVGKCSKVFKMTGSNGSIQLHFPSFLYFGLFFKFYTTNV